eukprot:9502805-Pyramimonas_sp.AAC.2
MPSWEPVQHDPFAEEEDKVDPGLPHKGLLNNVKRDSGSPSLDGDPATEEETKAEEEKPEKPLPNPLLPNFWAVISLIGVMLANGLTWFIQRWILGLRTRVKYSTASSLERGTYAYVVPHAHQVGGRTRQALQTVLRLRLYNTPERKAMCPNCGIPTVAPWSSACRVCNFIGD